MGFSFCDSVSASALESPRFSFPPNGIIFPPPHQARSAATSFLALPLTHPAANQSVPGGGNRPIIMTSNVANHGRRYAVPWSCWFDESFPLAWFPVLISVPKSCPFAAAESGALGGAFALAFPPSHPPPPHQSAPGGGRRLNNSSVERQNQRRALCVRWIYLLCGVADSFSNLFVCAITILGSSIFRGPATLLNNSRLHFHVS